jgi:NTE family protein
VTTRALVLGGGGIAGISWETGVLAGLAESGADVSDADLVVGTSAGSVVGAQLTTGMAPDRLLARQTEPAPPGTAEPAATPAPVAVFAEIGQGATDAADLRRRFAALALATDTVPEAERVRVIADRLPVHTWPDRALRVVAVDTADGELAVFDRASGAPLVEAVAASCAVPGVWPPVTIGGRRYMDGGMRSTENADVAAGHDKILVLQVFEIPGDSEWAMGLANQVAELRAAGSSVLVIRADAASLATFTDNPLNPAVRVPAALAGVTQGRAVADTVRAFWH